MPHKIGGMVFSDEDYQIWIEHEKRMKADPVGYDFVHNIEDKFLRDCLYNFYVNECKDDDEKYKAFSNLMQKIQNADLGVELPLYYQPVIDSEFQNKINKIEGTVWKLYKNLRAQ